MIGISWNLLSELHQNEKGNYFLLSIFVFILLFILTSGVVELGRVMVFRNQLQTATDAAAMAAVGSRDNITKWVKIVVTTDRGERIQCSKDECWCVECETRSIPVVGLEEELLEKGGWRDYCIEPCDCGGGKCSVEITSRWVTMNQASYSTGASPEDVNKAVEGLAKTTIESMSMMCQPYQPGVYNALNTAMSRSNVPGDLNAVKMAVSDYNSFLFWYRVGNNISNRDVARWNQSVREARVGYDILQSRMTLLNKMIAARDKIARLQPQMTTAGVTEDQIQDAMNDYLKANSPKASIEKIRVYDTQNSPYYPSVVVYATTDIHTLVKEFIYIPLLLDPEARYLFGEDVTSVTTCSQAMPYYIDPGRTDYSDYGELTASPEDRYYNHKPADACWKD